MEGAAVLVNENPSLRLADDTQAAAPHTSHDPSQEPEPELTAAIPQSTLPEDAATADPAEEASFVATTEAAEDDSPETITPVQIVEAILFAADTPLPGPKIAQALGVGDARDVRRHVAALNQKYGEIGATFRIQEISGGYQMLTMPVFNTWLAKLHRARQETRLSAAAMETLAVVAYKQPVTRAEIESIRGVAAGEVLNRLRELDLVKIAGRAEDLGRPLLYGTTRRFLEVFGLGSLDDLPKIEDTMFAPKMKGAGVDRPADMPPPAAPPVEGQAILDTAEASASASQELSPVAHAESAIEAVQDSRPTEPSE